MLAKVILFAAFALPCLAINQDADLREFITGAMAKGKIPGLSAAVVKGDRILWDGHFGSALPNITRGPQVAHDTIFEIASLSKTIVGISMMMVYEKGLVDLQGDINRYLPFNVRNPLYPDVPITIHGLLTHTSSISDNYYNTIPGPAIYHEGDATITLDAFMKMMFTPNGTWYSRQSYLKARPQSAYQYTNVGASLAGYIVERIAQRANLASTFDEFVRRQILDPLGVQKAGYLVKDFGGEQALRPPAGAFPSQYDPTLGAYKSYCFFGFPDYPDGAFKVSALDYAKIFGMFANDGAFNGTRLLKKSSVQYIKQKATCTPEPCGGDHRGTGVILPQSNVIFYYESLGGRTMLGHSGGEMGIATEAFFNVDTGVGFVVLTNGDWGQVDSDEFSQAFYSIERQLMNTFDHGAQAHHPADDMVHSIALGVGPRAPPFGRRKAKACPCGTPCSHPGPDVNLV